MITYVDTSVLLKLLVSDADGGEAAQSIWVAAGYVVCAEIGLVEARAALAAARRTGRLDPAAFEVAKAELNALWAQVDRVPVGTAIIEAAAELAETDALRGYDAVHLAAAIAAEAAVVASADAKLSAAAERHGFSVADTRVLSPGPERGRRPSS